MDTGRRKHHRWLEKHWGKECTSQNRDAEGLRTKTVWKIDFTVIQVFKKQYALCFIALKNTYATKVLLMHIGPTNNVVNSYYVFLLFYPGRELYAGENFKKKCIGINTFCWILMQEKANWETIFAFARLRRMKICNFCRKVHSGVWQSQKKVFLTCIWNIHLNFRVCLSEKKQFYPLKQNNFTYLKYSHIKALIYHHMGNSSWEWPKAHAENVLCCY